MTTTQTACRLEHAGFRILAGLHFRLTGDDRIPALVFGLDGAEAVLPIAAIPKLFDIQAGSADAKMLNLIGSALRFVSCVRPGDSLPTEVVTGEASWKPEPRHRERAAWGLQIKLLRWLGTDGGTAITPEMLLTGGAEVKRMVNEAFGKAATTLGVAGGATAVATLLDGLADELAYIEAMRDRLLHRARSVLAGLGQIERSGGRLPAARRETVQQVTRLLKTGIAQIASLFGEVDAQTEDIIHALRNLEGQCSQLRPNRDCIYCMCIAWEEELRRWKGLPNDVPDGENWPLVDSLYRFLAARYMNFEEWRKFDASSSTRHDNAVMVW